MKSLAIMTVIGLVLSGFPSTVEPLGSEGSEQLSQDSSPGARSGVPEDHPARRGGPLMRALDTDRDGELSAEEIEDAVASLLMLDENGDGKLSREELAPLAKINATSLKEYGYFTRLTINNTEYPFKDPTDYFLTEDNGRLTLHFILPLVKPVKASNETIVEIYDSEFYIAFEFKNKPASLTNAPTGCAVTYRPPGELDAKMISQLAAVPPDQRKLPPELRKVTLKLANLFIIRCPR